MQNLPPDTLIRLANDARFQYIIETDPELDRLEALQYNDKDEYAALLENTGLSRPVGSLPAGPVTPAVWCLLCAIRSPYACGGIVRKKDMEIFLYLLTCGIRHPGAPGEWAEKSAGLLAQTELTESAVHALLQERLRLAFLPFQLLPPRNHDSTETKQNFDAEWLNRICAVASERTHTPIRDVIHSMCLNQVLWHYVMHLQKFDRNHAIRRRPPDEIARRIMERTYDLARKYEENRIHRNL